MCYFSLFSRLWLLLWFMVILSMQIEVNMHFSFYIYVHNLIQAQHPFVHSCRSQMNFSIFRFWRQLLCWNPLGTPRRSEMTTRAASENLWRSLWRSEYSVLFNLQTSFQFKYITGYIINAPLSCLPSSRVAS